jgi:hypothetical protein
MNNDPVTFDALWASTQTWQKFLTWMQKQKILEKQDGLMFAGVVPDPINPSSIMGVNVITKQDLPYGTVLMVSKGQVAGIINLQVKKKGRH